MGCTFLRRGKGFCPGASRADCKSFKLDWKGERDNTWLVSDEQQDGTPKFEELHASEIPQAAPRGNEHNELQLKCFYTNACSLRNKQEELELCAQSESYDIIGITET